MISTDGQGARRLPFSLNALAAARVFAASGRPWFWLDGAAAPSGEKRVSYLGLATEVREAEPGLEREFLKQLEAPTSAETGGVTQRERIGFYSGWIVAFSYEFGVTLLGSEPARDSVATAFAMRAGAVLAIDHDTGVAQVRGCSEDLTEFVAEWGGVLAAAASVTWPSEARETGAGRLEPGAPVWARSDAQYRREVETCKAAIREGNAYVLCLTDSAHTRGDWDPLQVYLAARAHGPAARGGILVTATRALVSSSPERFLSRQGSALSTHPIKGTRGRGANAVEDAALAQQLRDDPKERAENLMIVDLMRNDFSRICAPGTVRVEDFLRVETHPHVHQLVSTVRGELTRGATTAEILSACFPGGSMTGAPKRSAVDILHSIERAPRGLYSGCFGWLDHSGDTELAMSIRCIEFRGEHSRFETAVVGAGGGITADSEPEREAAEKQHKAAAALAALLA